MALFLVWHDEDSVIALELGLALETFELRPGLILVDSELDLSPLYHRIKWALPPGSALLVAPLASLPKFKLMEKGALTWIKARKQAGFEPFEPGWDRAGFARINNLDQRDSGERESALDRFDTDP